MNIRLDYGRDGLTVSIPEANVVGVLRQRADAGCSDPLRAVSRALENPIGREPLRMLARGNDSACVAICDSTRPVPYRYILPPVLAALEAGGIAARNITILIATGTHRPNTMEEIAEMIGPEVASTYFVENHMSGDVSRNHFIGQSPSGIPVFLNSLWLDAPCRITLGLIEPHFMAGFSGGRKMVMPGLAAFSTIEQWHSPRFLESPLSANGSVDGNPVHDEALAIARMAPPHFILDVTLNEAGSIAGVFAGDMEEAWSAGIEHARQTAECGITCPADIVVTTCAGHPLDATFYQAVKGMVGALPAVKQDGTIIIAAECAQGVGSSRFKETLFSARDLEAFVREISLPGGARPEQWQVEELARAARKASIRMVTSGISRDDLAMCHVLPADSVEAALADALREHGTNASVAVIPRGPYVIPVNASENI